MPTKLQQLVQDYLDTHRFSKLELCRLAKLEVPTLEKILNHQHYVSIFEYQKLAYVLNVDTSFLLYLSSTE